MINLKWWFIFCASLTALGICAYLGLINALWSDDASKLSFVIIGLYFLFSMFLGYNTSLTHDRNNFPSIRSHIKTGWFVSEFMLGLGMIGTLIGFLILLNGTFASVDTSNASAVKELITHMAIGFSTSCLTTLVGLIASFMIKMQLVNIEYEMKHD